MNSNSGGKEKAKRYKKLHPTPQFTVCLHGPSHHLIGHLRCISRPLCPMMDCSTARKCRPNPQIVSVVWLIVFSSSSPFFLYHSLTCIYIWAERTVQSRVWRKRFESSMCPKKACDNCLLLATSHRLWWGAIRQRGRERNFSFSLTDWCISSTADATQKLPFNLSLHTSKARCLLLVLCLQSALSF